SRSRWPSGTSPGNTRATRRGRSSRRWRSSWRCRFRSSTCRCRNTSWAGSPSAGSRDRTALRLATIQHRARAPFVQPLAGHRFYPYDLPVDRFAVPPWIAGRTFYLIFPDRFANGDQMNDPAWKRPWGEAPTVKSFFGGDIPGIRQNLGWLTDLGVGGLYL